MRRKQRGFGPHRELEMMLVAALGIIAVVAFAAYQDYTIRERVAAWHNDGMRVYARLGQSRGWRSSR